MMPYTNGRRVVDNACAWLRDGELITLSSKSGTFAGWPEFKRINKQPAVILKLFYWPHKQGD